MRKGCPLFGLIKRPASDAHKTAIVRVAPAPDSLGNICANAVRRTDKLGAHGLFCEPLPSRDKTPNLIRDLLRNLINAEFFEISSLVPIVSNRPPKATDN